MKSLAIVFLLAAVGSALPTVTSGPQQGDDSLTRRGRSPTFCKLLCKSLWPDKDRNEDDRMEYKTCFEGCTKLAAEPGAPVDLDAIGESAVPTPPQPDESDTKSLTRREFCETVCSNLWPKREDDIKYELCVEGCTKVAAEPGAPVNLDDIEFGSGKA